MHSKFLRSASLVWILFLFNSAIAQVPARLLEIDVTGRGEDLSAVANTATEGQTGAKELSFRAFARPGEVVETVPGLIITQHDGGGKANQYYLRGFNLDHGTDLATFVDDVPLNMPSHAHGQGYTDTNWLIPELVKSVDYSKGPFAAEVGDFANAGQVKIEYQKQLPKNLVSVEGGTLGYARTLLAGSPTLGAGQSLYALELSHYDGAWTQPDNYNRLNGILRYSLGKDIGQAGHGFSLSAQGYYGQWIGSEQVPQRAIDSGLINRYGTLDASDGGLTHRLSAYAEWHRQSEISSTVVNAYVAHYGLDLYSNFTYFIDPVNGDQIQQKETRALGGLNVKHTIYGQLGSRPSDNSFGLQSREDNIQMDLNHTDQRAFTSAVRADHVVQDNLSAWFANRTQWFDCFRSVLGGRVDLFRFNDQSDNENNSGQKSAAAFSPKLNFIFGPFTQTELYLSLGTGIRSNDARGIFLTQPTADGPARSVPAIVRSRGAEVGVRNSSVQGYKTTLAFWLLDTDSDTFFSADTGTVDDSGRAGRRYGVEWSNFYEPNGWLMFDADFSFSRSRFTQDSADDPGDHIPEAVVSSVAAGVTIHDRPLCAGCFAGIRLRYFGARDLDTLGAQKSQPSSVFNFSGGYVFNKYWTLKAEVLNMLNAKYNDAEYYSQSRLRGEAAGPDQGGTDDHMVHPGEPLSLRLALLANY